MSDILISEIFGPTIQGEGALAGRLTVFVRTGGCDFRCNWCVAPDTPILMSDGREKAARDVEVGDGIWGMKRRESVPETAGSYQLGKVEGVARRQTPLARVRFEDGRELVGAREHALYCLPDERFRPMEELVTGDELGGNMEVLRVQSVELLPEGEVVSLRTSLGTYISNGVLSRNCDTLYAVLPEFKSDWTKMSAGQVIEKIEEHSFGKPILVTVSGGNPALAPLGELLELGHARGHTFALETQGSKAPDWLSELDFLTVSPKPPSSGMTFDADSVSRCLEMAQSGGKTGVSLKVVVFDEADYEFARGVWELFPGVPFFLSVGTSPSARIEGDTQQITRSVEWLIERVARDGWNEAVILPQIHVLLWGQKRGV